MNYGQEVDLSADRLVEICNTFDAIKAKVKSLEIENENLRDEVRGLRLYRMKYRDYQESIAGNSKKTKSADTASRL